ncbi:MAG TPA: outer membrane protein assembly factor BamA [Alphaproteobacteria bacterium]
MRGAVLHHLGHKLAVALAALIVCATLAHAQNLPAASEIRIEGAQRIEPETVRSYLSIREGDPIDPEALDRSLKSLFATGLFADVTIRREGNAVVVRVVENPIINRIAFEGNSKLSTKTLNDEIQLKPRKVFTRAQVQSDVQRILDLYRRAGRFAATVEPKIIQLPQNRVDLVFEISEGSVTEIRKITFVGNRAFSDSELRGVIQTKESAWWRILSASDSYDPDRLTFDRELLRRHYLANGYADFRVVSAVAELTPDYKGFFLTFTFEEGDRYKFGKVNIESAMRDLKPEALREYVSIKDGDWYDAEAVDSTVTKMTDELGSLGYAFVEVRPQVRRNREAKTVDVTFTVQEGPRVYVDRINITGNLRTTDKVIRREMQLAEGDAFSTAKMRRSRQRIRNLGFFERVDLNNVPGAAADRTTVNVAVRERSTGEISFGAGYSSTSGILGDISLRERNLLGSGQDLKLRLAIGQRETNIEASFTEPYFLDRNMAAGFDVFRTTRDLRRESSYDRDDIGTTLRAGYGIVENLTQQINYTIRQDDITNVSANASLLVREQEGTATTSSVGQSLTYDRRDNRFDPKEGYFGTYSSDVAGLGGSVHYLRNRLNGGYYVPLPGEFVGQINGTAGYVFGLAGDHVRITDKFFLGGANLRGFANAGAGPRDSVSGDAVGGKWIYRGSTEVTFPIGLPAELGVRGKLFADAGSLGDADSDIGNIIDTGTLRASIGTGLNWSSPFGPLSVDLGFPITRESFDKKELLRFNFGTRF